MKYGAMLIAAALGLWAVPATAQMVRAQDPESVAGALRKSGYKAVLGRDDTGDPMITSNIATTSFKIFFYNCTDHAACATVQLYAGYRVKPAVTLEQINEWNRDQRFGRAHIDKEGDPILMMDIDLDDGGVSLGLFADNIEFWASVIDKFEKRIGYK